MINENFVFVAGLITFIGIFLYALSTFRGKTQPNRVTWVLWTIVPLITFFAQLSESVGLIAVFSLAYALGPMLVVIASFANKKAYWKLTLFDITCGIISFIAVLLWLITGDGVVAIIFSILADFAAGLPTLIKGFKAPETENISAFAVGIIGSLITLATINAWNLASYIFPLYILLDSLLLCLTIKVFSKYRNSSKLDHKSNQT